MFPLFQTCTFVASFVHNMWLGIGQWSTDCQWKMFETKLSIVMKLLCSFKSINSFSLVLQMMVKKTIPTWTKSERNQGKQLLCLKLDV